MKKSTTYFVSSLNGNDENDGLSENTAFKSLNKINEIELMPGDKVFLLKGSVFENEFLHLKNCGDINADMIEITSYGDNGDLPKINTNGKGVWYQDYGNELDFGGHVYKGNVSSAILLYDVENILIKDIEITNKEKFKDMGGVGCHKCCTMGRSAGGGLCMALIQRCNRKYDYRQFHFVSCIVNDVLRLYKSAS